MMDIEGLEQIAEILGAGAERYEELPYNIDARIAAESLRAMQAKAFELAREISLRHD